MSPVTLSGRSVPEWIGKTPDTKVPPRVRLRIFLREDGMCSLSGRKIKPGEPWELEHRQALCNGGEHRESNLFPALRDKHKEKTAEDVAEKAKVNAIASAHLGIRRPPTLQGAGFPKFAPQRSASRKVEKWSAWNPGAPDDAA